MKDQNAETTENAQKHGQFEFMAEYSTAAGFTRQLSTKSIAVPEIIKPKYSMDDCIGKKSPCDFKDHEQRMGGCEQICKSVCLNGKPAHDCLCFQGFDLSCDRKTCSIDKG